MNRFRNRERKKARRDGSREPKKRWLVLCEGLTEEQYLNGVARLKREVLLEITVEGKLGDPSNVVKIAKDRKKQAEREAKRDANLQYDAVWCVVDVDDHERLSDARQMARDNGIEMAISNPAFELWLLLHFDDSPGMLPRDKAKQRLKKRLPDYSKHIRLSDLAQNGRTFEDVHAEATRRARRLDEQAEADGEPHRNPTTGVYKLTTEILNPTSRSSGSADAK